MCDQIILGPGIKNKISILSLFFSSNVIEATWVKPTSLYPSPSDFNFAKHTVQRCLGYFIKVALSFIDLNIYFVKSSHYYV